MKYLIFFIALISTAYSQVVLSEPFNDFPGIATGATANWRFVDSYHSASSGDSVYEDLTANGNDLKTFNGYADYAAILAACTQPSVSYSGGNALTFNGTTHSLELPDNTKLNFGTDDVTIQLWVYDADYTDGTQGWFSKYQDANNRMGFWHDASGFVGTYARDTGTYAWFYANTSSPFTNEKWHRVVITVDRSDTLKCYVDGVLVTFAETNLDAVTSVENTANFVVGTFLTSFLDGAIDELIITQGSLLTEKQVKESGFLAKDWVSTNGNVTRLRSGAGFEFAQTAWSDTLCIPLPDAILGANQEFVFDVKSKDTDGSGSTNWWIGKKREPKTVIKTVNCSASFENDKVYFGDGFALSSDTLWVAFGDTASVDNVVLSKASHHLIRNVTRWLTW